MHPAWVRAVRDQCPELGVSFFFKQVGNNHTDWPGITSKGTDMTEWPFDLRIQEYPRSIGSLGLLSLQRFGSFYCWRAIIESFTNGENDDC